MQVKADQLDSHLARDPAPLYVVHGDEPLLALEAADAIRVRARAAGCAEREVLIAERHFDWGQLRASAAGMSLFSERKLIELRIPSGKPGAEGSEALRAYCEPLVTENITIISLPRLNKTDQSSAWFSALAKAGVVVNVLSIVRAELPGWIAKRLARQKQRATEEALGFFAESIEGNLLAAHQEIQKLGLLFPEGEISFEQMRAAVLDVSRHDAYQLAEAMLAGDRARAAKVLDSLRGEGEAPPRLLWMLAEELHAMAQIQAGLADGRQAGELLRQNRIWGEPRVSLMNRAVRRVPSEGIEHALVRAARIDRIAKGVAKGDVWDELLQLTTSFAVT